MRRKLDNLLDGKRKRQITPKIELSFSSCKTIFANSSPTLYLYQSKQQINVFFTKKVAIPLPFQADDILTFRSSEKDNKLHK